MVRQGIYRHNAVVTGGQDATKEVSQNEWNDDLNKDGMMGFSSQSATITLATGSLAAVDSLLIVAAESGVTDDLDNITTGDTSTEDWLIVFADTGDTITLRDAQGGAGQIHTLDNSNQILSETIPTILMRRGADWYEWSRAAPVTESSTDIFSNKSFSDGITFNTAGAGNALTLTTAGSNIVIESDTSDQLRISGTGFDIDISGSGINLNNDSLSGINSLQQSGTTANTGVLRAINSTRGIAWRNAANDDDSWIEHDSGDDINIYLDGTLEYEFTGTSFNINGNTITNTGILTLPTSTDTIVARDTTDTLTNKTINTASNTITINAADVSDFDTQVRTSELNEMATPTTDVAWGSNKITGLADGTASGDAVNKSQLDVASDGLDAKGSVRVATTADITLSGEQTIDGVSTSTDRILVKNQSSGEENGIYVTAAGAWSRATDADISAEVTSGMYCWIEEGTANGDQGFVLTTNDPITLDTTPLVFTQFTGLGQVTAGTGLDKSGNTLNIDSTVTTLTGSQTLTNKILTSPVLTTPQINDTSLDHQYIFAVNELAADRTITLPLLLGNDTFVFEAFGATLTNKTIDLENNTLTGSVAEFNTALQSDSFATLGGTNSYTAINTFQDNSIEISNPADTFQYQIRAGAIGADRILNLPVLTGTDTLVVEALAATLTNKTLALGSNTISGSSAEFNTANTDDSFGFLGDTQTWTGTTNTFVDIVHTGRHQLDKGADVASADAPTLGGDGNVFDITGTTTINHIQNTGWQIGSKIILHFVGAVPLNHATGGETGDEASLYLNGDTNYTTSAGDILTFVLLESTQWQEVSRNSGSGSASLPVVDTTSIAEGSADATKEVRFEVDGNTTGVVGVLATAFTTAKTLTFPDATDTLVGKATTDTFTNKTFDLGGTGNSLTGSVSEFNTALQSDSFMTLASTNVVTGAIQITAGTMRIPLSATPTMAVDGDFAIDTTVTDFSHGIMKYYDGEEMAVISVPIAQLTTPTDNHVITYNATNDEFELVAAPGGSDTPWTVDHDFDVYFYDQERISKPANPAANNARTYVKQIDADNDGIFTIIKKSGSFTEVQIA